MRAVSQPLDGMLDDTTSQFSDGDQYEPDPDHEEHAEDADPAAAAVSEEVVHEPAAPLVVGSVRRGKIVFDPCLDQPTMTVPDEVSPEPSRKFCLDFTCRVIAFVLGMHGFRQTKKDPNWLLWWTSGSTVRASMLQTMSPHQRVNHFPRSSELSRKDRMSENICRMQQQHGFKSFDLVPRTYVLPRQAELLQEAASANREMLWIVKPIASSCGKGIYVTDKVDKISETEHLVVSQYIANPLLIDGFKFDLRIYVLVTSFDPLRVYVFDEGLVRFSTEKYEISKNSLKNSCVHLTNYSVNKNSDKFDDDDREDEGNKWSISAFREHLKKCGINDKLLFDRINDLVIRTVLSVEPSVRSACGMYQNHHSSCFELLGFDVLVEDNLRPWLVEVNLSPSLSCPNTVDRSIKSRLIADVMTIIGLVAKNPNSSKKKSKPAHPKKPVADNYSLLGEPTSFSASMMSELSVQERKVLKEVQHELDRSQQGGFKCVFPTQHTVSYSGYFDGPRPLNALVARMLWAQAGQSDLTASKAKVLSAKSGLVPFWKEDTPSRKVLKSEVQEEKQSKPNRSIRRIVSHALDCSPKLQSIRVSNKPGISPIILGRLHSLPSSKELRDREQELKNKSTAGDSPLDKLPELCLAPSSFNHDLKLPEVHATEP